MSTLSVMENFTVPLYGHSVDGERNIPASNISEILNLADIMLAEQLDFIQVSYPWKQQQWLQQSDALYCRGL